MVHGGLVYASLEAVLNTRLASKGRDSHEYKIALAKRAAMQQTIVKLMEDQKLDALVYPTMRRKPARIGEPQGGSTCQLSASTGFPAISMPAGFTADGPPVGVELLGRAFDDAKLVSYAYAYEQATHLHRAPARTPALGGGVSIPLVTWQASVRAPTATSTASAKFTFDPATSERAHLRHRRRRFSGRGYSGCRRSPRVAGRERPRHRGSFQPLFPEHCKKREALRSGPREDDVRGLVLADCCGRRALATCESRWQPPERK
jgi:amidase